MAAAGVRGVDDKRDERESSHYKYVILRIGKKWGYDKNGL